MNVVIPMVGLGKRFSDAGFTFPKPLINVRGKPMIEHCVRSLGIIGNYIFIIRLNSYSSILIEILQRIKPDCKIITTEKLTDGSVNSILLAEKLLDNDEELLTTNCDQILKWNPDDFLNYCNNYRCDGAVVTYPFEDIIIGNKSPYSFVEVDDNGNAIKFEEKFAISSNALCGIHYWKKGKDFISSSKELIKNNDRVNNEFYVSKTYNYLIKQGKSIRNYKLEKDQFISLGTPKDLYYYETT